MASFGVPRSGLGARLDLFRQREAAADTYYFAGVRSGIRSGKSLI